MSWKFQRLLNIPREVGRFEKVGTWLGKPGTWLRTGWNLTDDSLELDWRQLGTWLGYYELT